MSAVTPTINSGSSSHTDTVNSTYGLIETIAKQTFKNNLDKAEDE